MATSLLAEKVLRFLGQSGGLTNGRLYWHRHLLIPYGVPPEKAAILRTKLLHYFPSRSTDIQFRDATYAERRALAEKIADYIETEVNGRSCAASSNLTANEANPDWRSYLVPSDERELIFETDIERRAYLTPLRFWNRFRRALRHLCGRSTRENNEHCLWHGWTQTVTTAAHIACDSFATQFGKHFQVHSKVGGGEWTAHVAGSSRYLDVSLVCRGDIWIAFECEGAPYPKRGNWHEEFDKLSRLDEKVHLRVIQSFFNKEEGQRFRNGGLQSQIDGIKPSCVNQDLWLVCFGSFDTNGPDLKEHWSAFILSADWKVQPVQDKHPLCLRLVARRHEAHPCLEPD